MTALTVATCQFPVSGDIDHNAGWITRQTAEAAAVGARVAHFPEGALSGYAGTDFATFTGFDWDSHSFHAGNFPPERIADLSGCHHAGRDDRGGGVQQRVDLLPEHFRAGELVAVVLRAFRRDHDRPAGAQRSWCSDIPG
jgi:hypothetical protein